MTDDDRNTNSETLRLRRRRPNNAEGSGETTNGETENVNKLRILGDRERCNFLRSRDDVRKFLARIIRWRLKGKIDNQDLRALHVATTNVLKSMGDKSIEQIEDRLDRLEQLLRPRLVNER